MPDQIRKHQENEEGFTLIELMVVVLIIAILLAIAIPTFLGARNRSNDRAAQSSLRNGLTVAKVLFTENQDYLNATPGSLAAEEPSLTFQAAASSSFKVVSVDATAVTGAEFGAAALSKSGDCFLIRDISGVGGGTRYGVQSPSTACTGTAALSVTGLDW